MILVWMDSTAQAMIPSKMENESMSSLFHHPFSMLEPPSMALVTKGTDNQEMLSLENASIVLVGKLSYCDAHKLPLTLLSVTHSSNSEHHQTRRPCILKKIMKEDEPIKFDSDFIINGVKHSRGSRALLQFKGNQ